MHQDSGRDAENSTTKERNATDSRAASDTARRTMHQPEEACSPGVATRLAKRRSMDGAVPSTPPSSGKGKRRDAPSDYRADVSRALDVPAGSSGATDEEMHDRSPRESRSVSSDDADAREDIAAVAREAAVDRKVRVPSARQTPPLSMDDCVSETRERARTKHATSRCFPSVRRTRVDEIVHSRAVFFFFFFSPSNVFER